MRDAMSASTTAVKFFLSDGTLRSPPSNTPRCDQELLPLEAGVVSPKVLRLRIERLLEEEPQGHDVIQTHQLRFRFPLRGFCPRVRRRPARPDAQPIKPPARSTAA
jgi:hypothetical protein